MQEIFLKLIQHPLLWVFLATGGVYWLLTKVTPRDLKTRLSIPIPAPDAKRWWQDHYVIVVIGAGLVMIAVAFHYYLIDIIRSVRLIVAQLVALLSETQTPAPADIATPSQIGKSGDPTAIRDLSYAIAVLLGVLVAASTVPFALIRVWINDRTIKAAERSTAAAERTTNAAEQGLITDRINSAVTGLGVEKPSNKPHRMEQPPKTPTPISRCGLVRFMRWNAFHKTATATICRLWKFSALISAPMRLWTLKHQCRRKNHAPIFRPR
ncbi:hypothetical protein N9C56_06415 [Paracoccaceae bacterium]|nr:hypothetical protein [Paracoccaceae bacterium]